MYWNETYKRFLVINLKLPFNLSRYSLLIAGSGFNEIKQNSPEMATQYVWSNTIPFRSIYGLLHRQYFDFEHKQLFIIREGKCLILFISSFVLCISLLIRGQRLCYSISGQSSHTNRHINTQRQICFVENNFFL